MENREKKRFEKRIPFLPTDLLLFFRESSPLLRKIITGVVFNEIFDEISANITSRYTGYISSRHSVGRKTISIGRKAGEVSRPTLSIYSRVEDRHVAPVLEIDSEDPDASY